MQQNLLDDSIEIDQVEVFDAGLEPSPKPEDSTYWKDFAKWELECKNAKESYTYLRLDYQNNSTLTERHEWIHYTAGLEREWRGTNESYGGSWGSGTFEDLNDVKAVIKEFFMEHLDRPYNREFADEWAIRGIRRENIRVFYTVKVRAFILEMGGWDIVEFLKEMDIIPERAYDTDFELLWKEYHDTEKAKADIIDKGWKVDRQLQKYTSSYSDDDTDGDVVKGLYEQRKKLKKERALLELGVQELRNKLVKGY